MHHKAEMTQTPDAIPPIDPTIDYYKVFNLDPSLAGDAFKTRLEATYSLLRSVVTTPEASNQNLSFQQLNELDRLEQAHRILAEHRDDYDFKREEHAQAQATQSKISGLSIKLPSDAGQDALSLLPQQVLAQAKDNFKERYHRPWLKSTGELQKACEEHYRDCKHRLKATYDAANEKIMQKQRIQLQIIPSHLRSACQSESDSLNRRWRKRMETTLGDHFKLLKDIIVAQLDDVGALGDDWYRDTNFGRLVMPHAKQILIAHHAHDPGIVEKIYHDIIRDVDARQAVLSRQHEHVIDRAKTHFKNQWRDAREDALTGIGEMNKITENTLGKMDVLARKYRNRGPDASFNR